MKGKKTHYQNSSISQYTPAQKSAFDDSADLHSTDVVNSSMASGGDGTSVDGSSDLDLSNKKNNSQYKTEMCKNWQEKGKCCYGDKCRFAHGQQEMNVRHMNNQNYKTTPCHHFFSTGLCSYGIRCAFQHDVRQISEISNNYYQKRLFLATNSLFLDDDTSSRLSVFNQLTCTEKELSQQQQQKHHQTETAQKIPASRSSSSGADSSSNSSSNSMDKVQNNNNIIRRGDHLGAKSSSEGSDMNQNFVSNSESSKDNDYNQRLSSDKEEIMNSIFCN